MSLSLKFFYHVTDVSFINIVYAACIILYLACECTSNVQCLLQRLIEINKTKSTYISVHLNDINWIITNVSCSKYDSMI